MFFCEVIIIKFKNVLKLFILLVYLLFLFYRIRSEDFKTLEENIGQPIQIADNVKLQRSRTERFIEVFREQVSQNPVYNGYTAAEVCFNKYTYSLTFIDITCPLAT